MTTVQIPRRNRRPATTAQHGMWFTERLGTAGSAYHMPVPIRLDGELDVLALIDACAALVARHPVLGSSFEEHDGELFSIPALISPRVTLTTVPAPEPEAEEELAELVRAETLRPFDLRHGPLTRFTLFTSGPQRHLLLVVAHHLVFDGESKDILVRDLGELYRGFADGRTPDLPPLPVSYAEHAGAESARLSAELAPAGEFWGRHWHEPAPVVLPGLRHQQPAAAPGDTVDHLFDPCLRVALAGTADLLGATRFEVLLAAVQALLHRYGNTEPTVAVDLGTRTPLTRECVGLFVNEVPVTGAPRPDQTFRDLVAATRAALRDRYPFRTVPVARATAGVKPRIALAPVSISYRRRPSRPPFAGLTADVEWLAFNHTARNALHLQLLDSPEQLALRLQYGRDTLDRADATRIAGHFTTLLAAATAAPDTPLADLDLLDDHESDLLSAWSRPAPVDRGPAAPTGTPPSHRTEGTLPELFAARAAAAPDDPAVISGDRTWTYGQLSAAVDRLAARLRGYGVRPGDRVAVLVRRTPALPVALLGVLRAGAAYVPLDPDHPAARLDAILADAAPTILVTDQPSTGLSHSCPTLAPLTDDEPEHAGADLPPPHPDDLAYLIYTSGSTGQPKGVQIEHRALANLLLGMRDLLGSEPGHGWLALASAAFDMSKPELFLPLVTGGRMVLATEAQTRDGTALHRLVRRHGVTHVHATPSTWRLLLDAGFDQPDVVGLSGAEPLPPALAREVRNRVGRLWNLYGPTEATVWSTVGELPEEVDTVGIGEPIANTRRYLLDGRLNPVPVGIAGEVCLGGSGLARGYLNRPALTAAHFVPDPYGPAGSRLYRTGDLARYRHDGEVEFLGRIDNQVKIRGYRVELGEIEAHLGRHPDVLDCAVVLRDREGTGPVLVAYVVRRAGGGDPTPARLRQHLGGTLPAYLLPNLFVELPRLPLTGNGKLDRRALPDPPADTGTAPDPADGSQPGYTGVAREIFEIWRQVLRIDDIGPDDDLFDLGGHSLTVTQIAARMRRQLGIDLPLHVFFDSPTINGLVAAYATSTPATS
ncbi:non-ribosomal peptide synthetase [Micromonospora sp. NBC_01796]|uniref:non-ribosomal peptide synthetase n=1 Tax=Micromonospora sp. NBC_01796 TaxID=2975987 RepID=UPI002DDBAF7B|nr:amino acid adenylation domain-containing protein [Micromonospora sp. NBC_01796]WSA85603.1 amino acid adenylation domain-containing protein [Micromonospora sp. NBC_01796]